MTRKEKRLKKKPWLTRDLLKSIKVKNKMFKTLHTRVLRNNRRELIVEVEQCFEKYRNALTRLISEAKKNATIKYLLTIKTTQEKIGKLLIYLIILGKRKNYVT